ncbi:hypothetical protein [Paenibacillus agricola]|uniref:Uncharacterized protein n=1 Tax=Paenibacillus agricola TaxID=2716264 RepID=A0ABX0JJJ7_9BACL|nr:hypothetical protein [Paenibacillus agricola]NHN34689.1 hypothetical protein [Paenibacillus agricola]
MKKKSIPDAMISFNSTVLLIEAKIDNGRFDPQQIKDHEKKFADGENIQCPKYYYWEDIHSYFVEINQSDTFSGVTNFLLAQFILLLENMGLSKSKTVNFILAHFINQPDIYEVVVKARSYLESLPYVKPNPDIKDCFGFMLFKPNSVPTRKFFSISKKGIYILHMMNSKHAEEQQMKANKQFSGNKKKYVQGEKEAHININLVSTFEELKPYIDVAYQDRKDAHYKENNPLHYNDFSVSNKMTMKYFGR